MSTAPIDSGGAGGGIHRIFSHLTAHRQNSVGVRNNQTNTSPATTTTTNDTTWINTFYRLDRILSGSFSSFIISFY